jgi:hypothetical protein
MQNDSPPADLPRTRKQTNATSEPVESAERRQDEQTPAQKRLQAQTKKKHEFVTGLMNNLDILIYVELSILYYMEYVPARGYMFFKPLLICYIAAPSSVCSSESSIK